MSTQVNKKMSSIQEQFPYVKFNNQEGDGFNKYFAFFPQAITDFTKTRYRQTPKFGKEFSQQVGEGVPGLARETVKYSELRDLESWVPDITGPVRYDDRMHLTKTTLIFDDPTGTLVPVGGVPTETSSKITTSTQSFGRYSMGARVWDNMLNSPIGAFYLGMQVIQVGEAIHKSFFYRTIQTILRVPSKFLEWSVETEAFSRKNVHDYYQRLITRWDIIRLKDNGLPILLTDIDDDQIKYRASSNIVILPLKAQSFLRNVKDDQRNFSKIGNRSFAFQNKYNSKQPIDEIQQNRVYILTPQFNSDSTLTDHLLRHEQIGEWHGVYDRNFADNNPAAYTSNDITVKVYDQTQDSLVKISPIKLLKNSCVFDQNGRVFPRDTQFSNQSNVGTGFNTEDAKNDFLSRENGDPISLIGEERAYPVEHLNYLAEAFKHRLGATFYKNTTINEVFEAGIEVWQWLQNQEFNEEWEKTFLERYVKHGNTRRQRSSDVFRPNQNFQQLKQANTYASYDFNGFKSYVGLGSYQGVEAFSKINITNMTPSEVAKKIRAAGEFVKLMGRLTKVMKKVVPNSKPTDAKFNSLAYQVLKPEYTVADNALSRYNRLWVNMNAEVGKEEFAAYVIDTSKTSQAAITAALNDNNLKFANKLKSNELKAWIELNRRKDYSMAKDEATQTLKNIKQDIDGYKALLDQLKDVDDEELIQARLFQFTDLKKEKDPMTRSRAGLISFLVDIRLAIFDAIANGTETNLPTLYGYEGQINTEFKKTGDKLDVKQDMRDFLVKHSRSRISEEKPEEEFARFVSSIQQVINANKLTGDTEREFLTFFGLYKGTEGIKPLVKYLTEGFATAKENVEGVNKVIAFIKEILPKKFFEVLSNLLKKLYDTLFKEDEDDTPDGEFGVADRRAIKELLTVAPGMYLAPWARLQFRANDTGIDDGNLDHSPLYQQGFISFILKLLTGKKVKDFKTLFNTIIAPFSEEEKPKVYSRSGFKKWYASDKAVEIFGGDKKTNLQFYITTEGAETEARKAVDKDVQLLRDIDKINKQVKNVTDQELDDPINIDPLWVQTTLALSPSLAASLLKSGSKNWVPTSEQDENAPGTLEDLADLVNKINNAYKPTEFPSGVRDINKTMNNLPEDTQLGRHVSMGGKSGVSTEFFSRRVTKIDRRGLFKDKRDMFNQKQTRMPETNQEKLGTLTKDAISGNMRTLFRQLPSETNDLLVAAIARTILLSDFTLTNLTSMVKYHVPLPFEFVMYKNHMHYDTYTLIKIQGNGEAVLLYKGNPVFTIQNDAVKQEHYMQFSMTGGPFVVDSKFIYIQHNAIVSRSNGGASTQFYDPRRQMEDFQEYYDPYRGKFGSKSGNESIIVGIVPIGTVEKLPLDIDFTGHYHGMRQMGYLRGEDIRMPHVKWLDNYRRTLFWGVKAGSNRKSGDVIENVHNRSPNFMCHKAPTWYWSREKQCWPASNRINGRSHWGVKGSLPGAAQFRNGQSVELEK